MTGDNEDNATTQRSARNIISCDLNSSNEIFQLLILIVINVLLIRIVILSIIFQELLWL